MKRRWADNFVNTITAGNRPIRIFFFGGIFIAFLVMKILSSVLGIDTEIGGYIDLPGAVLMAVSLLIGFGISYSIIRFADVIKQRRTEEDR